MAYSKLQNAQVAKSSPKIAKYRNLRNKPIPNEVVAKGAFLLKVRPPIYAAVHAVMLSKKHQRSRTKADMQGCCYCIRKRMTKEALQNHCMRK